MTVTDVLADLHRALAVTEAVVAGIRADQWQAPTPCTELDVREAGPPALPLPQKSRSRRTPHRGPPCQVSRPPRVTGGFGRHSTIRRRAGSSMRRSPGSEVTTGWSLR
ncbi:MAG: hypothetical protein ACRD0H_16530, partial [Actinomycetes bacterium]